MSAQHTRKTPAQSRKNAWILATIIGMGVYVAAFMNAGGLDDHMTWLHWLGLAAAGVGTVSAFGWIASLDEVARQVHFEAWYWGGSLGLCLSAFGLLALFLTGSAGVDMAQRGFDAGVGLGIALGFVLAVLPAFIGYCVWWAALWLRKR